MVFKIIEDQSDIRNLAEFIKENILDIPTPSPTKATPRMLHRLYDKNDELKTKLTDFVLDEVRKNLSLFLIDEQRKINGLVCMEHLSWDSTHFNLKIGNIKYFIFYKEVTMEQKKQILDKIISLSKKNNYDLLYAIIPLPNYSFIHTLEASGGILTGISITLGQKSRGDGFDLDKDIKFRIGKKEDIPYVKKIAQGAFLNNNRFFNDPWLSKEKSNQLYEIWAEKSFSDFSDGIIIAEQNNIVKGFYTIKKKTINNLEIGAHLDLLATSNEVKGLGTILTNHFLKNCRNYTLLTAVTDSSNIAALNLYEKTGFRIIGSEAKLHIWLNKSSQ